MEYIENYHIEFSDCDENKRLKLPAMIDLLMGVSEHQLDQGGAGTDDLLKKGLGWVVTQYHIDIKHMPRALDKVVLTTNASGYNRFFEYRDFGIEDDKGNELVSVKSQWVLFDLKKRHLCPCDEKLMQQFNVPLLKKMPRFPRLRPLENYENKRQYRVRFDDLDTNHHLTNGHYFNWFIDMFSRDFLQKYEIARIDIKFDQEVKYGQMPYSCMSLNELKSYHAIEDESGNEKAVCEIEWCKSE